MLHLRDVYVLVMFAYEMVMVVTQGDGDKKDKETRERGSECGGGRWWWWGGALWRQEASH